ncbi:hypothetical protein P3T35_008031 [Kitasatospora sp. GP30]|uniref:hypothetical protein n=1 Tax=Kitasatospora sp. GP30 TaxID=3035084 RepID=UPI000C70C074|nr:hypothetical protein [Kitasatospora sp. GP30]MDH6145969.1 hypothetical protein [Kitasatospora sp. GP30]
MLKVTNSKAGWGINFTFEEDDPQGWLNRSLNLGHLENMLTALGDPMQYAQVKATGIEAEEQLRAVSWFADQLTRRQDALIVALRDRGTSWGQLARLVDPDEPEPQRLRSAMQRRYEAGRKRAGLTD